MFRRGACDETFGAKRPVISTCGKWEDCKCGIVPPGANLFAVPASVGTRNHSVFLSGGTPTKASQYERWGVWVPAFAEMTLGKGENLSTRRPCERRGPYAAADGTGTLRDVHFNGDRRRWQSVCHRASSIDPAVWVPAFAGTTLGNARPHQLDAPANAGTSCDPYSQLSAPPF